MIVQDWMSTELYTVRPNDTTATARRLVRKHRVRQLPVLRRNRLIGIVTDRDLRGSSDGAVSVDRVMTFQPHTVAPDDFVDSAAYLLRTWKINAVPVVSEDKVVGIITTSDLLDAFVALSGVSEPSYRLTILPRKGSRIETVRAIAETHGAEIRWMQVRRNVQPREVHTRLRSADIDSVTEALEAAGHSISCVLMASPARRHK